MAQLINGKTNRLSPVVPRFALVGEPTRARTRPLQYRNNLAPVPTFIPFGAPA